MHMGKDFNFCVRRPRRRPKHGGPQTGDFGAPHFVIAHREPESGKTMDVFPLLPTLRRLVSNEG